MFVNNLSEESIDAHLIKGATELSRWDEMLGGMTNDCILPYAARRSASGISPHRNRGLFDYLPIEATGIAEALLAQSTSAQR